MVGIVLVVQVGAWKNRCAGVGMWFVGKEFLVCSPRCLRVRSRWCLLWLHGSRCGCRGVLLAGCFVFVLEHGPDAEFSDGPVLVCCNDSACAGVGFDASAQVRNGLQDVVYNNVAGVPGSGVVGSVLFPELLVGVEV